jgi:hypothetical protein
MTIARDADAWVYQGGEVTIPVTVDDATDPVTLAVDEEPEGGTVEVVDGGFRYLADDGFSGEDSFIYTATDAGGDTDEALVTVGVVAEPSGDQQEEIEESAQRADELAAVLAVLMGLALAEIVPIPDLDGGGAQVPEPLEGYEENPLTGTLLAILEPFYRDRFPGESEAEDEAWDAFASEIAPMFDQLEPDGTQAQADRTAQMSATAMVNHIINEAAKLGPADSLVKSWWTRLDNRVRPTHRPMHGSTVPFGDKFQVGGVGMDYPGQPVGDPSLWINCRCVMTIAPANVAASFTEYRPQEVVTMMADDDTIDVEGVDDPRLDPEDDEVDEEELGGGMEDGVFAIPDMIPWYGVLAPEGKRSGDGRKFSPGALTHRDLPLPFRWQESDIGGHDGAKVIGNIQNMWREGDLYMGSGLLLDSEDADRFVGQVIDGAVRGISVDVDDAEMAANGAEDEMEFSKGRVCAATAVAIPAFAEAFVALGEYKGGPDDTSAPEPNGSQVEFKDYDQDARDRAADEGNALPDGSFPINDCADLSNAIQAIGRAKDPDAAKAHIRKRKGELGCEEVDLPDTWSVDGTTGLNPPDFNATVESFKRGSGWVTDPKETKRLHDYWTKPGEPGYAKVRWGTPGDFRRLRRHLAKYINPIYLNRTVAQWHHDALGYWPGECGKPGNPPCGKPRVASADVESVHLVASTQSSSPPQWWFTDPGLKGVTPVTIDGDRIFGHIAPWDQCHIGMEGVCTTAPRSATDYAYFRTGAVNTDLGLVPVGNITLDTGHAPLNKNARPAASHYDNTGTIVADVAAGEDEYGIWFAGALRPGLTDEQKHAVLAVGVSGDWRAIGGQLEMIAALCVPVPGFPIKRPLAAAASGMQTALVLPPVQQPDPIVSVNGEPVNDALVDAVVAAMAAREERREKVDAIEASIRAERVRSLQRHFS